MKVYVLEREQTISRSKRETFSFFSDASNLERITPPFLRFKILTKSPIEMKSGTLIKYRIKLFGIPLNWLTKIELWEPEDFFVDTQLTGPYSLWRHSHTFEEIRPNQTLIRDTVEYSLPFGVLGMLTHELFVKHTLKIIFDYRAKMTAQLLEAQVYPIAQSSQPGTD
ncbi:MAG: SRPBCC family protein [Blastocatellia bacterium]